MKKITEPKETMIEKIKEWLWWNGAEITAIVIVLSLGALLIWSCYAMDRARCYRAYANFQPEYVGLATGCMITVDEKRVPSSALRMTI